MFRLASRRVESEDGFTLIEVLITLAILSVTFVGILAAMATMIAAGAQNRSQSNTESAVRNFGEFVKSQPYAPCNANAKTTYQQAVDAAPSSIAPGMTLTVTKVEGWKGDSPATFFGDGLCVSDPGVQVVTITATPADQALGGQFSRTLSVTKRRAL